MFMRDPLPEVTWNTVHINSFCDWASCCHGGCQTKQTPGCNLASLWEKRPCKICSVTLTSARYADFCYGTHTCFWLCGQWRGSDEGIQLFTSRNYRHVHLLQLNTTACDWCNHSIWNSRSTWMKQCRWLPSGDSNICFDFKTARICLTKCITLHCSVL